MKGTMKQWVLSEPKKMELREVPIPEIGPKDILFKISYASVCGSDIPPYNGGHYIQKWPIVLGHEFCGYVVEAGSEVKDIPVGMRFMGTNLEWCGECDACKSGNVFGCEDITRKGLGFGRDGVFAEYCVLHNAMLNVSVYPLPDNINDLMASTCEPMCVGVGNCQMIKPTNSDRVVIYGAGIIGQSFIQAIKAEAPEAQILVSDVSELRLKLALESGADYVINPMKDGTALAKVQELWGYARYPYHYPDKNCGNATVSIECTSNPTCVAEAFRVLTYCGRVCLAAGYSDEATCTLHTDDMMHKNVQVIPGLMGNFGKSVEYMSNGKYRTEHLITHVYSLDDCDKAIHKAMDAAHSCKVCIKVDPTAPDYTYNKQED